ncbi:MAG: hypothetical protein R3307_09255, partial [Anaerolineales bacterium]|nr:hypothetical protein [Anaerolineales bacterium]
GAYVAYRALMETLKHSLPQLRVLELGPYDFTEQQGVGGDLALGMDLHRVLPDTYVTPNTSLITCDDLGDLPKADALLFENIREIRRTHCGASDHRLLIFRDSNGAFMVPYLAETFGYAYYDVNVPAAFEYMKRMVLEHKPDVVIEIRSSRWLRSPEG